MTFFSELIIPVVVMEIRNKLFGRRRKSVSFFRGEVCKAEICITGSCVAGKLLVCLNHVGDLTFSVGSLRLLVFQHLSPTGVSIPVS